MRAHIVIGVAGLALAGCTANPGPPSQPPPTPPPASAPSQLPSGAQCPVTPRNVTTNPDPNRFGYQHTNPAGTVLAGGADGNGVVMASPLRVSEDGWFGSKFGWWRGVTGKLTITGRRLDELAPPVRADIPDGYGSSGFQATGVYFATKGCWEITGEVGGQTLTFVVLVS